MELLNCEAERHLRRSCSITTFTEGRSQGNRQTPADILYPALKTSSYVVSIKAEYFTVLFIKFFC